ncbi:MAG: DUF1285 domain-containing protein [Spirochaetes bacterium]|nr:DUF1285 domain-containing protein [Spirochaetota bacterium]
MGRKYPEIPDYIKKMMQEGEELDEIRIDAEGRWFHNGAAFKNKKLISFFNKSIDITREGLYVINYSGFVYPIIVEDAPLFVTGWRLIKNKGGENILIALNSGEIEKLDLDSLHYKNNALYCFVRNGEISAKFKRSPCFDMLQNLQDNDDIYYLELCGKRIVLSEKMELEL